MSAHRHRLDPFQCNIHFYRFHLLNLILRFKSHHRNIDYRRNCSHCPCHTRHGSSSKNYWQSCWHMRMVAYNPCARSKSHRVVFLLSRNNRAPPNMSLPILVPHTLLSLLRDTSNMSTSPSFDSGQTGSCSTVCSCWRASLKKTDAARFMMKWAVCLVMVLQVQVTAHEWTSLSWLRFLCVLLSCNLAVWLN